MLIDTRNYDGDQVRADICIVGAGPAGITLALQMANRGFGVCLIESGGLQAEKATQSLNRGYNLGLPYEFGPGQRGRHLGGSSNCWGGFTQRWLPWDYYNRPWIRDSGWPFGIETLAPYYDRVENMLGIHADQYDPAWWSERLRGADLSRFPLQPDHLIDTMSALTPLRFGEYWREALSQSQRIHVLLWSTVTELEADKPASHVQKAIARTLGGKTITIEASRFVIATGGIETPRLLLSSRKSMPAGLGNERGLVGRYFMDHPRIYWGKVKLREAFHDNRLYDIKFNFIRTPLRVGAIQGSGVFRLPYEVQRRERLSNSQVWLRSKFYGETTEINMALSRMQQRLPGGRHPGFGFLSDLHTLLSQPIATTMTALGHLTTSRAFVTNTSLEGIFEPEPNRDSRVSLSGDLDALGMQRAQVDWRLTTNDHRNMERTMNLVADELERQEVATIDRDYGRISKQGDDHEVEGTWHPMGTTRMHASPGRGVVDANCKVHGLANLYIAGSSVFPTAGTNHPTIQLLALTYRLADFLAGEDDQATIRAAASQSEQAVTPLSQAEGQPLFERPTTPAVTQAPAPSVAPNAGQALRIVGEDRSARTDV